MIPPVADLTGWRFDHLGVVVRTLDRGMRHFAEAMGVCRWTEPLDDPVNGVRLAFGQDASGMVYELLEPLGEASPVHASLKARKNLLHHIAYRVPELEPAVERLRAARCLPVGPPKPAIAFGGARIQFLVTGIDTILELIEAPDHAHHFVTKAP